MKYVCELCGMIYDEEQGDPKHGIAAGTVFADIPAYYACPGCGSEREAYSPVGRINRAQVSENRADNFWSKAKYQADRDESDR